MLRSADNQLQQHGELWSKSNGRLMHMTNANALCLEFILCLSLQWSRTYLIQPTRIRLGAELTDVEMDSDVTNLLTMLMGCLKSKQVPKLGMVSLFYDTNYHEASEERHDDTHILRFRSRAAVLQVQRGTLYPPQVATRSTTATARDYHSHLIQPTQLQLFPVSYT